MPRVLTPAALALTLAALTLAAPAIAQEGPVYYDYGSPPFGVWLGGGIGLGAVDGALRSAPSAGLSAAAFGTVVVEPHVITVRAGAVDRIPLFGGERGAGDLGVLYGRVVAQSPDSFVSIGAGLAVVQVFGVEDGSAYTVGLPLEAQFLTRSDVLGQTGLYVFANVNARRTFAGVTFAYTLGFRP